MSKSMCWSHATQQPPLPKYIQDLTLEEIFTKSKSGQNFLLADDGVGPNIMLEFGLVRQCRAIEDVRKWRAAVLPLVPQLQVTESFLWLREMAPDLPQANAFHTYLYETWVAEDALFSRAIWNQFKSDTERTNNNVEGWHSKMNKLAHGKHVNIFEFIELIKQEQAENEVLMRMLYMMRQHAIT